MSRRANLRRAAAWALDDAETIAPPPEAETVRATLDDPALAEALNQAAGFGRLSDGDIRAMRAARRRTLAAGGTAALALVAGVGFWQNGRVAAGAPAATHYETQRGQELTVALADGSKLQLNGATSLDVALGADRRSVTLNRGEAYFDIAHEAKRPFVVDAAGSRTQVLGTAFDVDVGRREVKLSVYRGKVRFGGQSGGAGVTVPAGWRSRYSAGIVGAPIRFDATQQDWRQSWLDTDAMRLGDLVDVLNRRGGPLIQAPPKQLADLRISGRFKLDNAGQLIGAIGAGYGFEVVRDDPQLRLVPIADGDAEKSSR